MNEAQAVSLLELPTSVIKAASMNPRKILIYSNPKGGKTTIAAGLEGNLLIDFEGGAHFVDAMKIEARDILAVNKIVKALRTSKTRYKYITLDPITRLEDIVLPYAKKIYMSTPQGKNYTGENVLHLPNGAGYRFLREAFFAVLDAFADLTDHLIIMGHVKSTMIEKKGKEVKSTEVDLTGKIKQMLCADVDAIAYLERVGPDGFFVFASADDVICGARPPHLRNKQIHISHLEEDGSVTTYWNQIFLSEADSKKVNSQKKTVKKSTPMAPVDNTISEVGIWATPGSINFSEVTEEPADVAAEV